MPEAEELSVEKDEVVIEPGFDNLLDDDVPLAVESEETLVPGSTEEPEVTLASALDAEDELSADEEELVVKLGDRAEVKVISVVESEAAPALELDEGP